MDFIVREAKKQYTMTLQIAPFPTKKQAQERYLDKLRAVSYLFGNGYWRRVWIVQEINLAERLVVYHGHKSMDWQQMRKFCTSMMVHYWIEDLWFKERVQERIKRLRYTDGFKLITNHAKWRTGKFSTKGEKLIHLMSLYLYRACTDIRDRVYGLLGMIEMDGSGEELMMVDYTLTVQELFVETWLRIDKTGGFRRMDQRQRGEATTVLEFGLGVASKRYLGDPDLVVERQMFERTLAGSGPDILENAADWRHALQEYLALGFNSLPGFIYALQEHRLRKLEEIQNTEVVEDEERMGLES
jgi:hypothetical protein